MKYLQVVSLFVASLICAATQASVVVGGTRVVFDGTSKAAILSVENKDKTANLVQSWVTAVDSHSPSKDCLIITPPLFRLDAGEKASIRIVRSGKPMPEDRESMYWLNVKGIPAMQSAPDKNMVQIAINSQIKLIYRPASLKGAVPEKLANKLQWANNGQQLVVKNPAPLYMNFARVAVNNKPVSGAWFVAPFSEITIPAMDMPSHGKVEWQVINDYGMAGEVFSSSY